MATPRWGGLRLEPYDPDARDADGDGIVQEGTAWERPVGTRLLDELGRAIVGGRTSGTRPRGIRVVDRDGNDVDYTPTYGSAPSPGRAGRGSALSDHGAGSLRERGVPTVGESGGGLQQREARNVRAITDPNPESPKPTPETKPDVSTGPDRSPVAVPDNPEFHGVTRLDDRGFGNPKWNEFRKWSDQYGVTVRGTPLKWDDDKVPETLYHVSPAIKKIREDGVLKAAGEGGLGGDNRDRIVSMTTSRETAEQILDDMKLVRDVGRAKTPEEVVDVLRADASRHGIELSDEKIKALRGYAEDKSSAALNSYLWSRDTLGGPRNPLFFDLDTTMAKLANLDDDDFGIVEVDRKDLNNGALLTDFDLGEGNLDEIRSYGDVKINPDRIQASKSSKRPTPEAVPEAANPSGITSTSADRPDLVEPQKPRSPFKPSPPPLAGRAQELADEADGDFGKFMELLDKEGYVVFDYETTGLQDGNIPVQIGAVRIKDGEIVERFNVFTNPQRPLSQWSKDNLKDKDGNPLTDEWLSQQMDLAEAHKQLQEFMGDSIMVAHNLPYDGEIIERMMKDAGIEHKPSGSIDTLMLLRSAVPKGDGETGPERHTLGSLAEFFDVDLGDAAHTADADSEAAALVLQRAMKWSKDNDSDPEIFDAAKQKELFDAATKKYEAQRKQYDEDLKKYRADLDEYQRAMAQAAEPTPDYQMGHQPNEDGPRAHDLTEDGGEGAWLTDDIYKNPDRYSGADKAVVRETMEQLNRVKGDPDAKVTIYRWAPEGSEIEPGNWISLSPTYAKQHGESNSGGRAGSVISMEVPAREVRFAGDDLAEFGWWPEKDREVNQPQQPLDVSGVRSVKVGAPPKGPREGDNREDALQEDLDAGARLFEGVTEKRAGLFDEVTYLDADGKSVTRQRVLPEDEERIGFMEGGFEEAQEAKRNNAAEIGALLERDLSEQDIDAFLSERAKPWGGKGEIVLHKNGQISFVPAAEKRFNGEVVIRPDDPNYKRFASEAIADGLIKGWTGIGAGMDAGLDRNVISEMTDLTDRIFNGGEVPANLSPRERVIAAFLLGQYENTQKWLREQGVKSMILHRGMRIDEDHPLRPSMEVDPQFFGEMEFDLNALSASSFEWATAAYTFGEVGGRSGVVVTMEVPAERIMSTAVSGMGSLIENEVVIIGTKNMRSLIEWGYEE